MGNDLLGKTLGPYTIRRALGEGGMGVVYEAYEEALDRLVALKVIRDDLARREDYIARFSREAKLAARVTHPNLVAVYSTGLEAGCHYLAMELVKGESLREYIQAHGSLSVAEALRIAQGAARALAAIHAAGMVHRDIKPGNIMVDEQENVRLMDFGLAKPLAGETQITQGPVCMGSPQFMPPEQYRGESVEPASDIYALGLSLYEMLTGRAPFEPAPLPQLMRKVIEEGPTPISSIRPGLDRQVVQLIEDMSRRSRTERCRDANEVILRIQRILSEESSELPTTLDETTVRTEAPAPGSQAEAPRVRAPRSWPRIARRIALPALLVLWALIHHAYSDLRYLVLPERGRTEEMILVALEQWPPKNPEEIAGLIKDLKDRGAAAIGLDFVMDEQTSLDKDALRTAIAKAIREAGNVVVATDLEAGATQGLIPEIREAAGSGAGFANIARSRRDDIARKAYLQRGDEKAFAALLVEAFQQALPASAETPSDLPDSILIDYSSLASDLPITADLVREPGMAIKNKIIVIGTKSQHDAHRTPLYGKEHNVSGLQVQGAIVTTLLRRSWFRPLPILIWAPITALGIALAFLLGRALPPRWLPAALAGCIVIPLLIGCGALGALRLWVPMSMPAISMIIACEAGAWRSGKCAESPSQSQ